MRALVDCPPARRGEDELRFASPVMERLFDLIDRIAPQDTSVLLIGESGTGKELVARALHRRSHRRDGPFVGVNCAALAEPLLDRELFGHAAGAFADTPRARPGLLRQGEGGTLFLDELGDMSPSAQPKLLRALQERRMRPVGSDEEISLDLRVIAATNRDMRSAVAEKAFRADLYYRLAVVVLEVPPLRDREDDVTLLAEHFLDEASERLGRRVELSGESQLALRAHRWPGNVRELENAIEHATAVCRDAVIEIEHLPEEIRTSARGRREEVSAPRSSRVLLPLGEVERRHIVQVLAAVGGNKSHAAKILGIDRKTLHARLQRYGLGA